MSKRDPTIPLVYFGHAKDLLPAYEVGAVDVRFIGAIVQAKHEKAHARFKRLLRTYHAYRQAHGDTQEGMEI